MSKLKRATAHLREAHQLQLLRGGNAYFGSLVQEITRAQHEVRIETYIFEFDPSGCLVAEALEHAAARGVKVYLTMDGVGTPQLPAEWVERFDRAGVQWRIFLPLGRLGVLMPVRWRRLHRKLCVVDGAIAYCGGINVQDDFFDSVHGQLNQPRLDFALRVTGPLVRDVLEVMTRFWWRRTPAAEMRGRGLGAAWRDLRLSMQRAVADRRQSADAGAFGQSVAPGTAAPGARAQLVLRDNLRNRQKIERAYLKALGAARREVIVANAYFLPGARLRRALVHAARRGVRVRLLLQGRYEYFLQYHATRPLYGKLLEAGVEIHEYTASFMHAKVAVIDGHWATVGSSNLDPLSLLLAREANVVVDDVAFAGALRESLEQAITQGSRRVETAAFANRSWRQRALEALASAALRVGIFLTGRRY